MKFIIMWVGTVLLSLVVSFLIVWGLSVLIWNVILIGFLHLALPKLTLLIIIVIWAILTLVKAIL